MTLTEEQIAEIRARVEAATPGPWKWWTSNSWNRLKRDDCGVTQNVAEPFVSRSDSHPGLSISEEDMAFIAHARTDIPALLSALEVEKKRADEAEALVESMAFTASFIGVNPPIDNLEYYGPWRECSEAIAEAVCVDEDVYVRAKQVSALHKRHRDALAAQAELTTLRARVAELESASWQVLDDMGADGLSVCAATKHFLQCRYLGKPYRESEIGKFSGREIHVDNDDNAIHEVRAALKEKESGNDAG